ncbi:sulfotransferase domain-containing protein [uncultured Amphritea sp.]|uniref:sulfotransferase domain-containing protein n=1 Tax=uncultured Amphritea sp. TaxID=981605 RepID=UPI0025F5B971|nr:sulfotransferase domain-containing protein [uncultured Amphritea sp.]
MTVKLPNLFIVGPGRTGSTSLFRALSQSDDICVSSVKEIGRYRELLFGNELSSVSSYEKYFNPKGAEKYLVDGTPGYFVGGEIIANKIKEECGPSKIIITVRDPTDRSYSLYKHVRNKQGYSLDESFDEFVIKSIGFSANHIDEENVRYLCMEENRYGKLITEWSHTFGDESILILDYDKLNEIEYIRKNVGQFLDVDLSGISIPRDNVSTKPKYGFIHKQALKLNALFEPVLTKSPYFKRMLSRIYYMINSSIETESVQVVTRERINAFLKDDALRLRKVLSAKGIEVNWLR